MNTDQEERIHDLYLEMYEMLVAYACCSLSNEALSEEAAQETFQIACAKPDELFKSANPKGWLVNTLKNVIRNTKRKQGAFNRLFAVYVAANSEEIAVTENQISLEVLYGSVADTEDFRLIKEMAVDGRSQLEIAESRGITLNACKKRVQRAKENLRKRIE